MYFIRIVLLIASFVVITSCSGVARAQEAVDETGQTESDVKPEKKKQAKPQSRETKKRRKAKQQDANAADAVKKRLAAAKKRFQKLDVNQDDSLTLDEFGVIPKRLTDEALIAKRKANMEKTFDRQDTDADGKLSNQEFMAAIKKNLQARQKRLQNQDQPKKLQSQQKKQKQKKQAQQR